MHLDKEIAQNHWIHLTESGADLIKCVRGNRNIVEMRRRKRSERQGLGDQINLGRQARQDSPTPSSAEVDFLNITSSIGTVLKSYERLLGLGERTESIRKAC
jgi:hypothetical protein